MNGKMWLVFASIITLTSSQVATACQFKVKNDKKGDMYLVQTTKDSEKRVTTTPAPRLSVDEFKNFPEAVKASQGKTAKIHGNYFFVYRQDPIEKKLFKLHFKVAIHYCSPQGNIFNLSDIEYGNMDEKFIINDLEGEDKRDLISNEEIGRKESAAPRYLTNPAITDGKQWVMP